MDICYVEQILDFGRKHCNTETVALRWTALD